MSRLRTVMWASGASLMAALLDPQRIRQNGEDAVHDDDEHDAGNNSGSRCEADGRCAAPALDAAHAAGYRDQYAEYGALADADSEVDQMHAVDGLVDVF